MAQDSIQVGALVKQPVRVRAVHRGQTLLDQVFQTTPIRIGRLLDNDIVLPFDFASRYHCEIRCEDGQWTAVDLASKNGLLIDANTRMHEIALSDGDEFRIQEVTISLQFEVADDIVQDFHALHEAATIIGDFEDFNDPKALSRKSEIKAPPRPAPPAYAARAIVVPDEPSSISVVSKSNSVSNSISISISQPNSPSGPQGKRPLLDVDLNTLLFANHPLAFQVKERALQMVVVWHDQVIDAYEVAVGEAITWNFLGDKIDLGYVGIDKSQITIPDGCVPIRGDAGPRSMNVSMHESAAFRSGPNLLISFRYVPKSKDIARNLTWIEEKLVDPVILSSAVHGAAAITAIFVGNKHPSEPIRDEPERFAKIIIVPTPLVALQPSPTPTPTPTPTPLVAKEEPPKREKPKVMPTPKVVKTVVKQTKKRPPAIARKEEIAPPKVSALPKEIAKVEPPPKLKPPEPPAPTPPPFNAKSVGTLKALSALSLGPATNIANVEKIQLSRAPASVTGSMIGREPMSGTGDIISKLNQSARGQGDHSAVAIGGKASGKYGSRGLGGKAGTRNIRGTVIGGATYSELTKNEGLTREQVMKIVQKHQAQIQACYEKSLMSNPELVGRADFEWEITAKGSVTFVNVKEATLKNGENLLECVKGVFAKMKFPEAKNGENTTPTIGLPFGRL
jgi:hypothetical protein